MMQQSPIDILQPELKHNSEQLLMFECPAKLLPNPLLNAGACKIRTLGFYQPFGSLMLNGKIETRWVRKGKKPPFPLGKYVFYTTQKSCDMFTLFQWCGAEIMLSITNTLQNDSTKDLKEVALGIGELVEVRPLTIEDEAMAFVKFVGEKTELINGVEVTKVQWALIFKNLKPFEPFDWKINDKSIGKQGVGFLPDEFYSKVESLTAGSPCI